MVDNITGEQPVVEDIGSVLRSGLASGPLRTGSDTVVAIPHSPNRFNYQYTFGLISEMECPDQFGGLNVNSRFPRFVFESIAFPVN